jgi:hypothetical protein
MKATARKTVKKTTKPETVLVLRTCDAERKSYGGFQWPESGPVECSDWRDNFGCGGGLHGLLWGEGDGSLLNWTADALWLVVEVLTSDVRHGQGDMVKKCKFPRGTVLFCGTRDAAVAMVLTARPGSACVASTLTGGDDSTLTGGYASTLTGGDDSTLTGGNASTLTGGDASTLTGGNASTLTGGYASTLTGGDASGFTFKYWDGNKYRFAHGYVGEDGILPGVAYKCVSGKLVPVDPVKAAEVAAQIEAGKVSP